MVKIHPLADVQSQNIGYGSTIWQFAVILQGAKIGENCNINCHTFIENDVVLGNNVTVKSGVYLWDGLIVEDNVFIGPATVFTNDLKPRSKQYQAIVATTLKQGCSIGANSSILAGVTIGEYAMIGMGSNVTKDIPDHALVYGNPAVIKGWVDKNGDKLEKEGDKLWKSKQGDVYYEDSFGIKKLKHD